MKRIRVTVTRAGGGCTHEVFTGLTLTDLKLRVGKFLMSLDLTGVESITMKLE